MVISRSENLFLPIWLVSNERFFTSLRIAINVILSVAKNLCVYNNIPIDVCWLLLVLVAEEVVHCLHGIEGGEGYLYEDGVPIAHGAIPQTGEFECLE